MPRPNEHELKYVYSNNRIKPVLQLLNVACRPDPDFPQGIVSSIYYDTCKLNFLYEKINSDYLKTKFRVRWYDSIDGSILPSIAFAEVKHKIGGRRNKIRVQVPYEKRFLEQCKLHNQELLRLPSFLRNKEIHLPHDLFPVFIIKYTRYRYIEPVTGSRVCLDYNISVPKINSVFLPKAKTTKLCTAVFEIKGSRRSLPESLYCLTDIGFRKAAFSKYEICFKKIMNNIII